MMHTKFELKVQCGLKIDVAHVNTMRINVRSTKLL